jgi:hypothetical protein
VDVTAQPYNAPTAGGDATAAIQAAINAVCTSAPTGGGIIYLPATGTSGFSVTQAQGGSGSIAPVFNIPCGGITFRGGGQIANGGDQFGMAPQTVIQVATLGANPSAGPVFGFGAAYNTSANPNNGITLENLSISGYNQAVASRNNNNITLRNVVLSTQTTGFTGSGTTYTDNATLLTTSFWFKWLEGGTGSCASGNTGHDILLPADNLGSGTYDDTFENLVLTCSQFHSTIRQNTQIAGSLYFRNITREAAPSGSDFVTVSNDTGNACNLALTGGFTDILIDHLIDADAIGTGQAVLSFNSNMAGCVGRDILIRNSYAGNGSSGVQIRMNGGTLQSATVIGSSFGGTIAVVDGNGLPVGGAVVNNINGNDTIVFTGGDDPRGATGVPRRLSTDLFTQGLAPASGWGITASGNAQRSLAGDPINGILFANGIDAGYTANIQQSVREALDFSFAAAAPPSNFAGSATTGGSLAPGTYFYSIRADTTGNCSTIATASAPAITATGIVVGGGNNAVNLTWTPIAGAVANTSYCLQRQTTGSNFFNTQNGWTVSAPASSYLDTGANPSPWGGNGSYTNPLVNAHRVTPFSIDFIGQATPPPNPATNFCRVYFNLVSGQMSGLTSAGVNCLTGGGGSTVNNAAQFSDPYYYAAGTTNIISGNAPPVTNGQWLPEYVVTANAAVNKTINQVGLGGRAITGATNSDLIGFADNATVITHIHSASGTINPWTLPTPTTLLNPNFVVSVCNDTPQTDLLVPTTNTIQSGNAAAGANLPVAPGACYRIHVDPSNSGNWLADNSSLPVRYTASFTSTTSLSVPAATHGLGATFFNVTVYDSANPHNQVRPASVTIDNSGNVVVTFSVAFAGQIVIQ